MSDTATPGSEVAIAFGCTCPPDDNNQGDGFDWPAANDPKPHFAIRADCPLHGYPKQVDKLKEGNDQ